MDKGIFYQLKKAIFPCFRPRCHIVHLSAASALPLIIEARVAGAPLTVETCHHYLFLEAEKVAAVATQYKCRPPIRNNKNQVCVILLGLH
jgi:dihydroorotase-like cyclic amidohydrolase